MVSTENTTYFDPIQPGHLLDDKQDKMTLPGLEDGSLSAPEDDCSKKVSPTVKSKGDSEWGSDMEDDPLEASTYYPDSPCSKWQTAEAPQHQYGYDRALLMMEPERPKEEFQVTFVKALRLENSNKWKEAQEFELEMSTEMETWELVQPSPRRTVIETKWVFDVNLNWKGEIDLCKACVVAKMFSQFSDLKF